MSISSLPISVSETGVTPRYAFFRLPILFGPLFGYSWIPASGGKLLRVLLGTYEREQTALFEKYVRPGSRVLDIGAANGYYSLLAAHLAGRTGRVISFEPDGENAAYLREHISVNGLAQVMIHEWAIGESEGRLRFGAGKGTGTGRLCENGDREVRVRPLDDLFPGDTFHPDVIKIDVEGAEVSVLRGGAALIQNARPIIFLSTHGSGIHEECCRMLRGWGYSLSPILGNDLATTSEVLALPS